MHSCIYVGQLRHRRHAPVEHAFHYRLFMMYLDLDELPALFDRHWLWSARRPNLAWLRRRDHLGDPQQSLAESVRTEVEAATGRMPAGPIRLLTHLRYFGHCFNPVSFYYCFDAQDQAVQTILAEVNNTPWGEQHCYVLDKSDNTGTPTAHRYRLRKRFHVSPFMPMDIDYDWRFSSPGETLAVHMQNFHNGARLFDATLRLHRKAINSTALARTLASYPGITIKVAAAIYYQALRLWLKRTPFYEHPNHREVPDSAKAK